MKIRAIITGSTGMVGEGVLLECLANPSVEAVLVVNRRPSGRTHPKLRELVHSDFFNWSPLEDQLTGYNACFFCLGVSSLGMEKEKYRRITYDLTLNFAGVVARQNPGIGFCYVTGAGTDSSEKGSVGWARVKGATENALLRMIPKSYMFRPGFMRAVPGQRNLKTFYRMLAWLYPIGRRIYPNGFCTLEEVGKAMICVTRDGFPKQVLEVQDIVRAAQSC
jgi:uncharacterized protein YbjT (DUF2867 family)